ncbi:MAG: 2-oxoacid:acceptor oxidoreductase family protein [Halanaerobium sp.]|nr:2-oxoacid:acceptor oxidoreductase family protein [Halanaerobium sp.]
MKEFRIHGRGGQGSVATAELLAIAAFENGFESQAFPYLGGGGERRGAPVQAFARIDTEPIRLKCQIENPHYVLVQDVTLLGQVDVLKGIRENGVVLVNTELEVGELDWEPGDDLQIYTFPATEIALEILGRPIMNTSMIGALAVILNGEISVESLQKAARRKFPGEVGEKNAEAVEVAFNKARQLFE